MTRGLVSCSQVVAAVVSAAAPRGRVRTGSASLAVATPGTTTTRVAVEVKGVSAVGSAKTKDKATQGDLEGVASVAVAAEEEAVALEAAAKVCRTFFYIPL